MIERKNGVVTVSLSELDIAWAKRLVRQDQEHQSRLAADPRLTEEESVWIARDPGVSLYELPASEIGLLANRWVDERWEVLLFERVCQTYSTDQACRVMFAEARLEMLECVLGTQAFSAAIAEREAAWQRRFKEAEEAERNLPPCLVCGGPRKFVSVSS